MSGWKRKQDLRLGNWQGRRHSSRDVYGMLPRAWSHALVGRLSIVILTAAGLTALVYLNCPPFPYRFGSVLPHEFRARIAFEVPNQAFAAQQVDTDYGGETGDDTAGVSPPVDHYAMGAVLVRRGQKIDGPKLVLLLAEHRAYAASLSPADEAAHLVSIALVVFLLAGLLTLYVARFQPALAACPLRIAGIGFLVLVCIACALRLSRPPWDAAIIPLTITGMVLVIAYNSPFALLLSFCLSIVMSIGEGTGLSMMLIHSGGLATAVLTLREIRSRSRPVAVSAMAGAAYLALTIAVGLSELQPARLYVLDGFRYFVWSLLAGFILCGSLPFVERCFGVMTDATLLELADGSHALLQELVRRAPGTYTHSMTVATLAEAAAEVIGANALLARVGSYFHDVGKMLKPHYFIENQVGENRHDSLEPALSTLVITGHVKDGVALAQQYRLPRPIVQMIQQHHGTTLVEYFYREALRLHEESGFKGDELQYAFRYPGPKPQTREAGILMLADAAESSSRALQGPSASCLRKLVHELLMKRLLDGQFDDCDLTLAELKLVEESISKNLIAVYHARIRYEEPRKEVS